MLSEIGSMSGIGCYRQPMQEADLRGSIGAVAVGCGLHGPQARGTVGTVVCGWKGAGETGAIRHGTNSSVW